MMRLLTAFALLGTPALAQPCTPYYTAGCRAGNPPTINPSPLPQSSTPSPSSQLPLNPKTGMPETRGGNQYQGAPYDPYAPIPNMYGR
jgi:hypothetical protein